MFLSVHMRIRLRFINTGRQLLRYSTAGEVKAFSVVWALNFVKVLRHGCCK